MSKYCRFSFYKLILAKVTRNLRNIFLGKIPLILKNLRKTFFTGKKSNFKFQNRGYFEKNKLKS